MPSPKEHATRRFVAKKTYRRDPKVRQRVYDRAEGVSKAVRETTGFILVSEDGNEDSEETYKWSEDLTNSER
jgi:hypothetical protein